MDYILSDIRDAVKEDIDLEDEDFIDSSEIDRHIRRGVKAAQKIVLGLNEDYFLARTTLELVAGTSEYALPTGIYAHKIRRLIYDNGSQSYVIRRVKELSRTASPIQNHAVNDLSYLIVSSGEDPMITFYPTPQESGNSVTIWFLRTAKDLQNDDDVLDIPEAFDFVVQYAKDMCVAKEKGTPDSGPTAALMNEQALLEGDLMNRVPDDDNEIQPDTSFYEECN